MRNALGFLFGLVLISVCACYRSNPQKSHLIGMWVSEDDTQALLLEAPNQGRVYDLYERGRATQYMPIYWKSYGGKFFFGFADEDANENYEEELSFHLSNDRRFLTFNKSKYPISHSKYIRKNAFSRIKL